MNYLQLHDKFISSRKNRELCEGVQYENHHIVPRCLGGGNESSNLVSLTLREHIFVHRLLSKIYPHHSGLNYSVVLLSKGKYGDTRHHPRGMKGKTQSSHCKTLVSDFMKKNNPNKNKPPWRLSNVVPEVWSQSQIFYERWLKLDKPSYYKLCKSLDIEWKSGHQNMVMRFRDGWIPNQDKDWIRWRNSLNGV
jgi:hypothetical protein